MVAIKEVRSANLAIKDKTTNLTAVFVGATHGIGLETLRACAKHTPQPSAIIIGRSQSRFEPELANLRQLNAKGQYTFLESDVSPIKNIGAVCKKATAELKGTKIDLLYLSQGYISFAGREDNADGLDNSISLRHYGRIFEDDTDLEKNYSIPNSMAHFSTLHTLSFDYLAQQNPDKTFTHVFPGLVATGLLGRSATSILDLLFRWVVQPIMGAFVMTRPEDVGERMLYYGTSENIKGNAKVAVTLDENGVAKELDVLKGYREGQWADRVWEPNQRMFERALSR